jgi:hypothetical protein
MTYSVKYKIRHGKHWITWKLPVPTLQDALGLVAECLNRNIDYHAHIDIRVERVYQKESPK